MKNKYYALIFTIIWFFFLYEVFTLYVFLEVNPRPVLTSPFGNSIVSLSADAKDGFYYYHLYEVNKVNNPNLLNWLFGLSPIIAAIIFFQLSILFILLFSKIRKIENAFLWFSISISLQYILFFDFISYHKFDFFYYLYTLWSNVGFLFLFFTLLNRKLQWYFYALALMILFGIVFHFYPDSAYEEITFFKIIGIAHAITFLICFSVFIFDEIHPRARYSVRSRNLRRLFAITSLSIIFIPIVSYLLPIYRHVQISIYYNAVFYIPAIFPMILMIFSLQNSYIFFNKPVKTWYLRLVYFIFYVFLYGIIVSFEGQFVANRSSLLIIHIASVFAFIFIFDALRLLSEITMSYYINYRKYIFDEHITDIFQYIQTPFQFEDGIKRFLKMTEAGSGASRVTLLLNGDLFGDWLIEKNNIRLVGEDDPIWNYRKKGFFSSRKRIMTMDNSGLAGLFVRKHSGILMIFFQNFKAAIILSEKNNLSPYLSEDLKYLYDLIGQIEPILENYKLLIDNIETKKFEKELEIVSRLQNKLKRNELKSKHIEINIHSQPYRFVTGDYLEVFHLTENKYLLLLGDVSGHGLASAYFMAMVRSLIDGLIHTNTYSLTEIFNLINATLIAKQSSTSFMTLTAIELNLEKHKGGFKAVLNYINAGQHFPMVYLKKSAQLIELPGNQRVLGVVKTDYTVSQKIFNENIRLILTSDGAFEIFNDKGEILGEPKFWEWIQETADLPSEDQKNKLMNYIKDYNYDPDMFDDISILIIDINIEN